MIVDQGFDDVSREPFTIVRLCAADEGIIPLLVAAHQSAQGARRLLLARLLAWHRSAEGVPTLIAAFEGQVGGGSLPAITRAYRYAGIPPDNGIMPEPCYLLHALKMTGDPRVVPLLGRVTALWDPPVEAFRSRTDGAFHYADTVCQVAERLEDPRAVAALLELASRAAIRGRVHTAPEPDFILDRLAYLELCTSRALARCGSDEGRRLLQAYAGDGRALFARMAREELKRFRGSRG